MFCLGLGPLNGGKTLRSALVYIDIDLSSTELIYLEIVRCGLTLGLGELYCVLLVFYFIEYQYQTESKRSETFWRIFMRQK